MPVNSARIIERLNVYGYRYHVDDTTMKIFLPFLCYLKIKFNPEGIRVTSHVQVALPSLPLEMNFLFYSLGLYLLTWYKWTSLNRGVFVLIALFITYFVICFISQKALSFIAVSYCANYVSQCLEEGLFDIIRILASLEAMYPF